MLFPSVRNEFNPFDDSQRILPRCSLVRCIIRKISEQDKLDALRDTMFTGLVFSHGGAIFTVRDIRDDREIGLKPGRFEND